MSMVATDEPRCQEAEQEEAVELVIHARPRDLGGFTVGRVLPAAKRRSVGPFVFLDLMGRGDGRQAPSAHRAEHGDLSVRGREHPPRQLGVGAAHPGRRPQYHDRGPRRGAFRAPGPRAAGAWRTVPRRTDLARAAGQRRGLRAELRAPSAGDAAHGCASCRRARAGPHRLSARCALSRAAPQRAAAHRSEAGDRGVPGAALRWARARP